MKVVSIVFADQTASEIESPDGQIEVTPHTGFLAVTRADGSREFFNPDFVVRIHIASEPKKEPLLIPQCEYEYRGRDAKPPHRCERDAAHPGKHVATLAPGSLLEWS